MHLATFIATFAASFSPTQNAATTANAVVFVRGPERFEPLVSFGEAGAVPVPLLSRSERIVRAARTPRGLGVRVFSGENALPAPTTNAKAPIRVRYIEHADDERIVRDSARNLWRITAARLPRSVHRHDSQDELAPWIARQDGVGLDGRLEIDVDAPKVDERLVFLATEIEGGSASEPTAKATLAFVHEGATPALTSHPLDWPRRAFGAAISLAGTPLAEHAVLELADGANVDQILVAKLVRVDASESSVKPLACREIESGPARVLGRDSRGGMGPSWPVVEFDRKASQTAEVALAARIPDGLSNGVAELWFESPPETKPGRTITLLVDIEGDRDPRCNEPRAKEPRKPALFRDVAREVGIDMVHMEGPDLQLDIRPTMGPGAAWGDIDGDGWVDLFLPQGGGREGTNVPTSRMYRNRRDGTFEDVTVKSGLALRGLGMGALFFDADGDGDLDLFVANYGKNQFLVNDGHGRFTDASDAVGLQGESWHAAIAAADCDGDGDLDVYVTSYLHYDESQMPPAEELGRYQREDPIAMLPYAFAGERKLLLRNDGPNDVSTRVIEAAAKSPSTALRFTDATDAFGFADKDGRGMQAIFWDFDRDGDQDLYLANDVSPNRFWRNDGHGKWKDIGFTTGVDDPRGSMGLAVGDVDGDGDEDLFVTNWQLESNALYINNLLSPTSSKSHVATFRDNAVQAGVAQLSVGLTKWGVELADFDLDGDLDLFYANGYTSPDYESTGICVGQPCHYFENDGEGHFTAAFEKAGADVALPLSARCALACDYDQDGDLDIVVTSNNGRVRLLRNETSHENRHWLGVRLHAKGVNTFAIGAEVTLKSGGKQLRRSMRAGTSYLGGNAPELHFGLGATSRVDECIVRWPDGKESKHTIAITDAFVTLAEPE